MWLGGAFFLWTAVFLPRPGWWVVCVVGVGRHLAAVSLLPGCSRRGVGVWWADTLSGSHSTLGPLVVGCVLGGCWACSLGLPPVLGWFWWVWWVVCELYSGCEHLFVLWFCLVFVGIRWMPWHQELMKDVAACDMPRGVGERVLIRGCPNGGTQPGLCLVTII